MGTKWITVKGARQHNLKNVNVKIPRDKFVVITGLSGSGKSSLAFDTIYAEGQRRYVESLSAYARQFLEQLGKPDVDSIEGLSPAISIEQKTTSKNPRSTVGTVTEIYDYLRLLYARVGRPYCYSCGKPIQSQTIQQIVDEILTFEPGAKILLMAPVAQGRKGEYRKEFKRWAKEGYVRVKVDGEMYELEAPPKLDKKKKHDIDVVIDRLVIKEGLARRLTDSVETALRLANGLCKVEVVGKDVRLFSERFACLTCGISYPEMEPRMFSFNNPHGACPSCDGLGSRMYFDPDLVVPNPGLSLREGAVAPWANRFSVYFYQMLEAIADHYKFDIYTPFVKLPDKVQSSILNGSGEDEINFFYEQEDRRYYVRRPFEGVIPNLERRYKETSSEMIRDELRRFMSVTPCPDCGGSRLRIEARNVKIGAYPIHDLTSQSIKQVSEFFSSLRLNKTDMKIGRRILKEIAERLGFLEAVGLTYLTLDRNSASLSGGEGQRIRLATQVGSSLVGVLYILDEPSIGLHPRDNVRLLKMLIRLRNLGNTVLVVEHDAECILRADHVIDMGPGAGRKGGEVIFSGTPKALVRSAQSLTGAYLSGKKSIEIPAKRKGPTKRKLVVMGASENNLKKIDAAFPIGRFICVTGVSGSGKSSLVIDTLFRALSQRLFRSKVKAGKHISIKGMSYIDKVIDIDQSPIGRTPRSNPATYTGLFTHIRELFASLPESKVRGYKPGRYSFNVKGGRCEACSGDGIIKIEMHFLPDVYITCEHCQGKRYNRDTLEVKYKGASIADVLSMTVNAALTFMENIPQIAKKLQTLADVGLGYIRLGQSATTLSGGEAQRIKLSRELSKRSTGRTLYLLDEPTTGLHFEDIKKLLSVLNRLRDEGNTIVVIEHNLDVIKTADWIIDLGPDGGDDGGRIVAEGRPEDIAKIEESHTGHFLKTVLAEK
jgi:excinuclease ABC subunit A